MPTTSLLCRQKAHVQSCVILTNVIIIMYVHVCIVLIGVSTTRTSAYHPEGNGQVERFNRTLEAMLAKIIEDDRRE